MIGNDDARAAFAAAVESGTLHHAWLIAGPEGVGKATFAGEAALSLLAGRMDVAASHPARALMAAGSHPDFRLLTRLPKDADKPDGEIARSITVAQVRSLQSLFATTASLSARRVVVIDAIDDMERSGANALLKSLEEPPADAVFLLVSHAPGRLLPTIRSRCRMLRFGALDDADTATVLHNALPNADVKDVAALTEVAQGAPGRALRFAGLDIAAIDAALTAIATEGDPSNVRRAALARSLSGKAAQPRYQAFLERAPSLVAQFARERQGAKLLSALEIQRETRDLADAALGLSLDAQATVWDMAGRIAALSRHDAA